MNDFCSGSRSDYWWILGMFMASLLTFKQFEEFKPINTIGYIVALALYRSTKIIFLTHLMQRIVFCQFQHFV